MCWNNLWTSPPNIENPRITHVTHCLWGSTGYLYFNWVPLLQLTMKGYNIKTIGESRYLSLRCAAQLKSLLVSSYTWQIVQLLWIQVPQQRHLIWFDYNICFLNWHVFFCPMPLESFFLITWLKSRDDKKLKMQCNGLNHKNLEPHFYIHFVGEKSQQHWQRPRHVWRIVVESSGGMWAGTPNSSLGISSHLASTWARVSSSSFSPLPSNPLKSIMLRSSKFFGIAQVQ